MTRRWHEPEAAPGYFQGSHDLTGANVSLLPVAAEMRERDAARTARAARRRASWLFRLVSRVRDWRARWDRGAEGPARPAWEVRGRSCPGCGCRLQDWPNLLCSACEKVDREMTRQVIGDTLAELSTSEVLGVARATCLRDGRPDLAAAVHTVLLLDMTGNLDDMAPLVAAVRGAFEKALGDDPRVN